MKLLLPIIFLVIGLGVGAGAGMMFAPEHPELACEGSDCPEADKTDAEEAKAEDVLEYLRLQNQFVVPVVREQLVRSLVVLSLSLETKPEAVDTIYAREPKLRDAFLRVLFDHAHMGGFDGAFTESGRLSLLRVALLEAAQATVGKDVTDILITDIVRQEL